MTADSVDRFMELVMDDVMAAQAARHENARRLDRYRPQSEAKHTGRRFGLAPQPALRALPPMDEDAFDTAVGAFHRAYTHAYRPTVASEQAEAHQEAVRDGLEAFLGCYIERMTR